MQTEFHEVECSEGNFTPYWFSVNNLETITAVTLEFCTIQ